MKVYLCMSLVDRSITILIRGEGEGITGDAGYTYPVGTKEYEKLLALGMGEHSYQQVSDLLATGG